MSDEELRALERRWRSSGSLTDLEALLRARQRHGLLEEKYLRVAAFCGDAHVLAMLPENERPFLTSKELGRLIAVSPPTVLKWARVRRCPHKTSEEIRGRPKVFDPIAVMAWRRKNLAYPEEGSQATTLLASGLHATDPDAASRAGIAAAWVAFLACAKKDTPVELVAAEKRILEDPTEDDTAVEEPTDDDIDLWDMMGSFYEITPNVFERTPLLLRQALEGVEGQRRVRSGKGSRSFLQRWNAIEAVRNSFWALVCSRVSTIDTSRERDVARLLKKCFLEIDQAIQDEVVPWALGFGDPLAKRVARRAAGEKNVVPTFQERPDEPAEEDARTGAPSLKQLEFVRSVLVRKGLDEKTVLGMAPKTRGRYGYYWVDDDAPEPRTLEDLDRRQVTALLDRFKEEAVEEKRAAPAPAKEAGPEKPSALAAAAKDAKLSWTGRLGAVRPRISMALVNGEPTHGYEGYVLHVNGSVEGTPGWFTVAIGPAAQVKHAFRKGDEVKGKGQKSPGHWDLQKATALELVKREDAPAAEEPPFLGPPPPLEDYRARGYVRMEGAGGPECRSCIWACRMPMEGEPRPAAVCYGPATCRLRPKA